MQPSRNTEKAPDLKAEILRVLRQSREGSTAKDLMLNSDELRRYDQSALRMALLALIESGQVTWGNKSELKAAPETVAQ
jgi:hypothetical protein